KCGCFGASGLLGVVASTFWSPSRPARPITPRPVPRRWSIVRRLIGCAENNGCMGVTPGFMSYPPRPCTRGRGVGGEGVLTDSPPHPNPSPPSTGARGARISIHVHKLIAAEHHLGEPFPARQAVGGLLHRIIRGG